MKGAKVCEKMAVKQLPTVHSGRARGGMWWERLKMVSQAVLTGSPQLTHRQEDRTQRVGTNLATLAHTATITAYQCVQEIPQ